MYYCVIANRKLNMGLDESHLKNNRECQIFTNHLDKKKEKNGSDNITVKANTWNVHKCTRIDTYF